MNKPREFYVSEVDYVYYDEHPGLDDCDLVHVIEKSAYDKAVEVLKEISAMTSCVEAPDYAYETLKQLGEI